MSKDVLKEIEEEFNRAENDESLKDVTFSKAGEDLLFERIAKYKEENTQKKEVEESVNAYDLLSEEDRELLELGREVKEHDQRYVKKRSKRVIFALAAALVLTFAMGTVGISSRYKDLQSEEKYAEEVQYKLLESEEDLIRPDDMVAEQEAKQRIEEFFGQPVLWLYGEEIGISFMESYVRDNIGVVEILYEIEGYIITLQIYKNSNKMSKMELSEEVKEKEEVVRIGEIDYFILDYERKELMMNQYEISFEENKLYYNLIIYEKGMSEIEDILKNIK